MRVIIRDFRGCHRADFEFSGICLLAGQNGAGKSSIIDAVRHAVTGLLLTPQMTKTEADGLVRVGAKRASVEVQTADGGIKVLYPVTERTMIGTPPTMTSTAAGVNAIDLPTIDSKERAKHLIRLLKAEASEADLRRELVAAGISDKAPVDQDGNPTLDSKGGPIAAEVDRVIADHPLKLGWDEAHKAAKGRRTERSGAWCEVTGSKAYPKKAAGDFMPPGWTDDLQDADRDNLESDVAVALLARDKAVGGAAVDEAMLKQLSDLIATLPVLRDAADAASTKMTDAARLVEEAKKARDALPSAQAESHACPHCGKPLSVKNDHVTNQLRLEKVVGDIGDVELKKRRTAKADADGTLSNLQAASAVAYKDAGKALAAVELAEKAEVELRLLRQRAAAPSVDAATVAAADLALRDARERLAAFDTKQRADAIHREIWILDIVRELLAPEGVRQQKMAGALKTFNEAVLEPLADYAKWERVVIHPDLSITYGRHAYIRVSESEQWRARALLRIAAVQVEKAPMVILDGADALLPGKNSLFKLLLSLKLPCLVGMAAAKVTEESVPDMSKVGGITLWVADGVAEPAVWPPKHDNTILAAG